MRDPLGKRNTPAPRRSYGIYRIVRELFRNCSGEARCEFRIRIYRILVHKVSSVFVSGIYEVAFYDHPRFPEKLEGFVVFFLFSACAIDHIANFFGFAPRRFGKVMALGGEDEAAPRADDHTLSVAVHSRGDDVCNVTALGVNARNEDWDVARELP